MKLWITRLDIGYRCHLSSKTTRGGWRQVGPDARYVMDDFGSLVQVGEP